MFFGHVPIFIGGDEGLRVEQRGPVRGAKNPSLRDYLRSQKKWKIALSNFKTLPVVWPKPQVRQLQLL